MYGTAGHVGGYREDGSQRDYVDPRTLPPWLRDQFIRDTAGENGVPTWMLNGNLHTQDGRQVVQLGDNSGDEGAIDTSRIWQDADLGQVTSPDNVHRTQRISRAEPWLAALGVVGGGLAAGALGAGEVAGAVGGDALAGTEIANTYAAGANPLLYSGNAADLAAAGGVGASAGGAAYTPFESGYPGNAPIGAGSGSNLGAMYGTDLPPDVGGDVFAGGSAAADGGTVNPSVWEAIQRGDYATAARLAGQNVADNPLRALQLAQLGGSVIGGLTQGNGNQGGDNGPSELGSTGWKPPQAGPYQSATYDPRYGSPYAGWQEQYAASLKPLGRMYGR